MQANAVLETMSQGTKFPADCQENPLLAAALGYAEEGFKVFPCSAGDKAPLVRGGFKSATLDAAQIRNWWSKWPQAMIGVPTGDVTGVLAVDCDGDGGIVAFHSLCQAHGFDPAVTLYQTTPSDGRHYLFRAPGEDVRCSTSKLAPSVDVRANGGYIVVAPSRRADGRGYRWVDEDAPHAPLPDWLLSMLLALDTKVPTAQTPPSPPTTRKSGTTAYGRAALEAECQKLATAASGGRNEALNESAFRLGQLVGGGEICESDARESLDRAAHACGLCEDDGQVAAQKTIESGFSAGLKSPRSAPKVVEQPVQWEQPVPFTETDVPALDVDILPRSIGAYIAAVAEASQTPPELPLSAVLATLSTAAMGRFAVRVNAGYAEPVNVFTLCCLDPANRKSQVFKEVTAPLLAWERDMAASLGADIRKAQSEYATMERRIAHKRAAAAKLDDEADVRAAQEEIAALEAALPDVPSCPRLATGDATSEALAALMVENHGSTAVLSAEAGVFDILAGLYSNGRANLDIVLKGHSGDAVRVDRKNSPPIILDRPSLTVGLTAQTVVLTDRAASRAFRGRGLDGRFLYFIPKSTLGYRKIDAAPIHEKVSGDFHRRIRAILPLLWSGGREQAEPVEILLSPDADTVRRDFAGEVEMTLRPGAKADGLTDWAGKLVGATLRIAGLFQLAAQGQQPEEIRAETMQRAVQLGRFLSEHARAAYALMDGTTATESARTALTWVLRQQEPFSARDAHAALRGRAAFTSSDAVRAALSELEERGYLRERAAPYRGQGRKPGALYEVNPLARQ